MKARRWLRSLGLLQRDLTAGGLEAAQAHRRRVAAARRIQRWLVLEVHSRMPSAPHCSAVKNCNTSSRYYRLQRHVKLGRDRRERVMQERTKQARNVIVAARPYWLQGYAPLDPQPALSRFHGMCMRHPVFAAEWRGGRLVMCARCSLQRGGA